MQAECLGFDTIPGSSRLFLDYLYHFPRVSRFYAHPPSALNELLELKAPPKTPAFRERLAEIITDQNRRWNASPRTIGNIERLASGASAVLTGQQVVLFGGPCYVLYKALSAIHLSRKMEGAGNSAVPVFWMATEDHDLAEANHAYIPVDGTLERITTSSQGIASAAVGSIQLAEDIEGLIQKIKEDFGDSEICRIVEESYRPGRTFADAFASLLSRVFSEAGLIIVDPSDARLHQLAAPLYLQVISESADLDALVLERNKELEAGGYEAQVKVTESTSFLFMMRKGSRRAIRRRDEKFFVEDEVLSAEQLRQALQQNPEKFSANALLRPVAQDYLFPTAAYIGGPAEIAYFAQSQVLYQKLLGRTTPILPRFSTTLIEPRIAQWLNKYRLEFRDVLRPEEQLSVDLAKHVLPENLQRKFEESKEELEAKLKPLEEALRRLDPTLAEAAETAMQKMHYQLERLKGRAAQAEMRRNEEIVRHARALSASLYPDQELQERSVAWIYFLAKYGTGFSQQLLESARPECAGHQLLFL